MSNILVILFIIYVVNKFVNGQHFPPTGGEWPTNKGGRPRPQPSQNKQPKGFFEGKPALMQDQRSSQPQVEEQTGQGPGSVAAQAGELSLQPAAMVEPKPLLSTLSRQEVINGMILGEILGPPVARRRRPR